MTGPIIVCLCGSTRFKKTFEQAAREETLAGRIVVAPGIYFHADNEKLTPDKKDFLDQLHLRKIELADEVLVIDCCGYIGDSTASEIAYAITKGKLVRYWSKEHPEIVGRERMVGSGCGKEKGKEQ